MKKRRVHKRRARCTRLRKQVTRLQHSSVQYEVLAGIYERALDETEDVLRKTNWKLRDSQKLARALAEHNTELSTRLYRAKQYVRHSSALLIVSTTCFAAFVVINALY